MQLLTDQELLTRMARRDEQAFAAFYNRFGAVLFSIAFRMLGSREEAEDVLQEALLQVWNKADRFDPALGSALSWAIALTRNKAIDKLRVRQRKPSLVELPSDQDDLGPVESRQAWNFLQDRETSAAVREALRALPEEQRYPIELAFFGGCSQSEIAQILEEPLGTVKARIRRGMMRMREPLEKLRSST